MKLLLKISSEKNLLKAMGSEVKTGKYYNNAGKVAMRIHKKNTYHFDYSKGKKQGYAKHSDYSRMTHGLKHESEFQKQTKGKIKGKAGLHAEKHRTKKGHTTTKWVKNANPGVKGTKQRAGSKVNDVKPKPKQTGKQEPVANRRGHITLTEGKLIKDVKKDSTHQTIDGFSIHVPAGKTMDYVKKEGAIEANANAANELRSNKKITELASQVEPKVRPLPKHMTDKMKKNGVVIDRSSSTDGYGWRSGSYGNYTFQAKIYPTNKDNVHGINEGPVSKLTVFHNRKTILNYDRGWDLRPKEQHHKAVKDILDALDKENERLYESSMAPYKQGEMKSELDRVLRNGYAVRAARFTNPDAYHKRIDELVNSSKSLQELQELARKKKRQRLLNYWEPSKKKAPEVDASKMPYEEYIKNLNAEIARMHQEDVDANGGYEVEQYGYNIDPKKPSAISGMKKYGELYKHALHPADKIKHIHEHFDKREVSELGKKHKVALTGL